MATQNEIQLKLDRFKELISKSGNIKNEMKDILENATIDFGPRVSSVSRDEIFRIYDARLRLLEAKGKYNESFADLLKGLENVDHNLRLAITLLRTRGNTYAVFTDKDYHECFGVIYGNE